MNLNTTGTGKVTSATVDQEAYSSNWRAGKQVLDGLGVSNNSINNKMKSEISLDLVTWESYPNW